MEGAGSPRICGSPAQVPGPEESLPVCKRDGEVSALDTDS